MTYMRCNKLDSLKVGKAMKSDDYMYCQIQGECGEKGHCGKDCADYNLINKRSGICKNNGLAYEPSEEITIT